MYNRPLHPRDEGYHEDLTVPQLWKQEPLSEQSGQRKFHLVMCKDCGLTRFFARVEATEKVSSSRKWEQV